MKFVGYSVVVVDVDEYGEPCEYGIAEVFVCDKCKVAKENIVMRGFIHHVEAYEYIKELNGMFAKPIEGYEFLS